MLLSGRTVDFDTRLQVHTVLCVHVLACLFLPEHGLLLAFCLVQDCIFGIRQHGAVHWRAGCLTWIQWSGQLLYHWNRWLKLSWEFIAANISISLTRFTLARRAQKIWWRTILIKICFFLFFGAFWLWKQPHQNLFHDYNIVVNICVQRS